MVAPGFRTRIASSLLVVATALPVSMTAGPALAADLRATPAARPDEPLDDFAADPPLAEDRLEEQYPDAPERLPDLPGADDFRDLPDIVLGVSGTLPGFPNDPAGPFAHEPRHHHPHHFFGPHFPWRPDPAADAEEYVTDDSADADAAEPSAPPRASAPAPAPARHAPRRPAPARHDDESPAPSGSGRAANEATRPSPTRPRDLADAPAPAHHRRAPSLAPEPDHTAAGPEPGASPYALDVPGTRVERVLPMGAGMTLTGLGLAFLGLRLRRR
ncbi:hypothetical protein [Streptomyces sp. WZ-12]|uniref:hypothetical protein n=1 Tax=Streptomyces sp. WZ-12 TaxID=3030210 RepID=UPI002380F1B2|nr:hypothetical protein [Streptomyces sp. WZ-12]